MELDFDGFPEILALRDELSRLRAEVDIAEMGFVGASAGMQTLRRLVARVASSEIPVIVRGETGTGKELVARAIHRASRRAAAPFISESCAAFSESVLRSELFGHERGAFTGAHAARRGLFELAHGGTLFLDEVAEMSPRVQSSLLRVLQEGTLRRLGGEDEVAVDVRVLTATHRDLRAMVAEGSFREDLYYRLRGAELTVPPLRERVSDIPLLVDSFLSELDDAPRVAGSVHGVLDRYAWPGNVRELRAEVVRWSVFGGRVITVNDLSPEIRGVSPIRAEEPSNPRAPRPLREVVHRAEEEAIRDALERHRQNLSRTARELQIDRNTLKKKMRRMGLR